MSAYGWFFTRSRCAITFQLVKPRIQPNISTNLLKSVFILINNGCEAKILPKSGFLHKNRGQMFFK